MATGSLESIVTAILGRDHSSEVLCIDRFLGDDAIRLLASKVSCNQNKEKLVLRGNCIGPTGAEALAVILKESSSLNFVSLEWNQIGSEGATSLAEALVFNTSLVHVDLRNNGIGDDGALALVKMLEENDTLKTLDLRWNQIGDAGAMAFKSAIQRRNPPVFVQMKGNPLSANMSALTDGWLQGLDESLSGDQTQLQPQSIVTVSVAEAELESQSGSLVHNAFQSAVLQKETAVLRSQCSKLQASCADMQRQLDSSALRVLQLEQLVLRHDFRASQLTDAHKESVSRLDRAMEEHKDAAAAWDIERTELGDEVKKIVKMKDADIRILINEKGSLKDRLQKLEEETERAADRFQGTMVQSESERDSAQRDLRDALATISSLTAQEKKLEGDVAGLNSQLKRSSDRLARAEKDLEQSTAESKREAQRSNVRHEEEVKALKSNSAALLEASEKKTETMKKELSDLLSQVTGLESDLIRQKMSLEEKYDIGVATARETERANLNSTIHDLKQRIEVFLSFRAELEARCEGYVTELKDVQMESAAQRKNLETHALSLQTELDRQRSLNLSLKGNLSAAENDCRVKSGELEIAKRNLRTQQSECETAQLLLAEVTLERQQLKDRNLRLEVQLKNAADTRAAEFDSICDNVTRAMSNELESLRVHMHFKEKEKEKVTS